MVGWAFNFLDEIITDLPSYKATVFGEELMWKHEEQNVSNVILKEKQDLVEGQFTWKRKGNC